MVKDTKRAIGGYEELGRQVGELVDLKNKSYGNSFNQSGEIIKILYPEGVEPEQYADMLAIIRIIDKLFRIANKKDAFGESAFQDLAGYGLLGWARSIKEDNDKEK